MSYSHLFNKGVINIQDQLLSVNISSVIIFVSSCIAIAAIIIISKILKKDFPVDDDGLKSSKFSIKYEKYILYMYITMIIFFMVMTLISIFTAPY